MDQFSYMVKLMEVQAIKIREYETEIASLKSSLSPEQQDAKANLDAVEEKYKNEISYLSQLLTVSEQK
jgi:hypothetical protein